ncbi:primase-helicase zinc-binding domain-containing protein [uncultured Desulfovibrio sp.]|uniref:primase-helicase zinc-binding domain-containing protein n=1 Tax=uncultured Desulfovibrio sp. TaxID=167968 RepID=UPI0025E1F318|nr:primase-helicase zinc-binding domain-containing protein [uncultured Desulfovibrio sp.]
MTILDLLTQRGLKPVRVSGTHGGEYACPCPTCGGNDRFRAWPQQQGQGCEGGTWYCRGCGKGGDCIQFLRDCDGKSYKEACKILGMQAKSGGYRPLSMPKESREARDFEPKSSFELPPAAWREHAAKLVDYAHNLLVADPARMVQMAQRGIWADAVDRYRLGWLPGEKGGDCYYKQRAAWGLPEVLKENGRQKPLWIPAGLVIPAISQSGEICRLRVRRPDEARARALPDMKFAVIPGSSMHPLLLRPQCRAFVVVESELDAIACAAAAEAEGLDVGAISVGTNVGKPDLTAHAILSKALCILVALDFDPPKENGKRPGAQGFEFWARTYRTARRWPVPAGKDPGEAVAAGVDLAVWIRAGLPPVFSLPQSSPVAPAPAPVAQSFGQAHAPLAREGNITEGEGAAEVAQRQTGADLAQRENALPLIPPGGTSRAARLTTAAGPRDSLRILERAGLRAKRDGDDFKIFGHERWSLDDVVRLTAWMRTNGQWVYMAIHDKECANV